MIKTILAFSLSLIAFVTSAQIEQDVVYLKNGNVLKGKVIQQDSLIKIEILGGSIFVYNSSDVVKMEKEAYKKVDFKGPITLQQDGWFTELSFGIPFGTDQWGWPTAGVTLNGILGYQFYRLVKAGLGTGIDYYGYEATMLPIYARLTGDLTSKTTSPFYVFDLGYSSNISIESEGENHFGGFLLHAGAGFKFNTRKKLFYNLSFGFKSQFARSHYFHSWLENDYVERRHFKRWEGRLAIGF